MTAYIQECVHISKSAISLYSSILIIFLNKGSVLEFGKTVKMYLKILNFIEKLIWKSGAFSRFFDSESLENGVHSV